MSGKCTRVQAMHRQQLKKAACISSTTAAWWSKLGKCNEKCNAIILDGNLPPLRLSASSAYCGHLTMSAQASHQ